MDLVGQFYLVKLHPYQDPKLNSKIEHAQASIKSIRENKVQIAEELEFKKMDLEKLNSNTRYRTYYRGGSNWYNKECIARDLNFFQRSYDKLSLPDDYEEQIKELKRQLVHDQRQGKAKEHKIFKELNDVIRTKETVSSDSSHAEENAKIIKRWGSKDEIRQKIQLLQNDLKSSSRGRRLTRKEARELHRRQQHKASVEKDLRAFESKLLDLNKKKAEAHECILHSNKLQATIKVDYDEYLATSNAAKELAMDKDINGLQELINRANERFMSKWNTKDFREVYKKRVISSLDRRGLNLDALMDN